MQGATALCPLRHLWDQGPSSISAPSASSECLLFRHMARRAHAAPRVRLEPAARRELSLPPTEATNSWRNSACGLQVYIRTIRSAPVRWLRKGSCIFGRCLHPWWASLQLVSRSYCYLRRRSPGPPFPPDASQAGEHHPAVCILLCVWRLVDLYKGNGGRTTRPLGGLSFLTFYPN